MTNDELDALGERVTQFGCMELPGQPRMMHMGTSYLVHDLWRAVRELRERVRELESMPVADEVEAMAAYLIGGMDNVTVAQLRRTSAMLRSLSRQIAERDAEIARAREVAMIRHCDVNANGKTILDFHEVWLRQANERAYKAEADLARQNAANDMIEAERDAAREIIWRCYESIYGHRNASAIDPYETVARAVIAIVEQRDDALRSLEAITEQIAPVRAERDALRDWLDNNMTHYNTAEAGARPILADHGKRVWYHVTDDAESFPFSATIDAAMKEPPA